MKSEVKPTPDGEKIRLEVRNHSRTLMYGAEHLRSEKFSHTFLKELHRPLMTGIIVPELEHTLGKYKVRENYIKSSTGAVIYIYRPPHLKQKSTMDELISFMNSVNDSVHPLIKAAMIHSQFESIHPFSDGNGRIGRILISLYLYKANVINFPFFYISEAINMDKSVYYRMMTDSREHSLDEWIKYFLRKVSVQTAKHIGYIDDLNVLYIKTKNTVKECISIPKFDEIIEYLFTSPVLTANLLEDKISVSHGQAIRYLNVLEKNTFYLGMIGNAAKLFILLNCWIWLLGYSGKIRKAVVLLLA